MMLYENASWNQQDAIRLGGEHLLAAITGELEAMQYAANRSGRSQTRFMYGYQISLLAQTETPMFMVGSSLLITTSLPEVVRFLYKSNQE